MKINIPTLLASLDQQIRWAYSIRLIYYLFAALIVFLLDLTVYGAMTKGFVIIGLLAWPQLAMLLSIALKGQHISARKIALIDAFIVGALLTLLQFSPLPAIALLVSLVAGVIYFLGPVYLLSCFSSLVAGLFLTGLYLGFNMMIDVNMSVIMLSAIMPMFFVISLGTGQYVSTRQIKKKRDSLAKSNEELEGIVEMVRMASSYEKLENLIHAVAKPLQKKFPFETISVQLIDEDGLLCLRMLYGETVDKKIVEQLKSVKISTGSKDSISNYVMHTGKHFYIRRIDARQDMLPADRQLYNLMSCLSMLILPIETNNQVVGCISFYSHSAIFDLSESDITFIKRYLYPISRVVENANKSREAKQTDKKIEKLHEEYSKIQEALNAETAQLNRLSRRLSRYLSPQVYNAVFSEKELDLAKTELVNYRKLLTIINCGIYGFNELTDAVEPELSALVLNSYINTMSEIAGRYGGTIDKFIGDNLVIFFGDPQSYGKEEDALKGVLMTLEMKKKMQELTHMWVEHGITKELYFRAGINTGYCSVGNFGGESRLEYSILGNQVNIAEKLKDHAKPNQLLLSHETDALIQEKVYCEQRGSIGLKGVDKKIHIFEIIDEYKNIDKQGSSLKSDMPGFSLDINFDRITEEDKESLIEAINKSIEMINKS